MELKAEKRLVTGKAVNKLRRTGTLPAALYGHKSPSVSLSLSLRDFQKVYAESGEAELIDLVIGTDAPVKVLVKDVQREPLTNEITHADLYQVTLTEKVTATVPLKFIGESEPVKSGSALLLTLLDEIEVIALPLDLPSEILVDISSLVNIGDHISVKDLDVNKEKVVLKHEPEDLVVKLDHPEMKEEEVVAEATPEEVEITKEKKEDETTETEGKEPAEKEEKKEKKD